MEQRRTLDSKRPGRMLKVVLPALSAILAVAAGAIHLAHNYLPMQGPTSTTSTAFAAPAAAMSEAAGWTSLIMPHLSQVMVLNFAAFVGLAAVLLVIARLRSSLRVLVDVMLAALSVATLYAWNAVGRANPLGTGTLALVVELALIVIALADAAFVAVAPIVSRRIAMRPA